MAEDEKDAIIVRLRDQFQERCETLNGLIFQARDEWLGERKGKGVHGKWKNNSAELFDPEVGFKVPHWKEIPYINETASENLAEEIELVRELQGNLEQKFSNNQFDADFAASWGLFCYLIGGFDTLLNARPEHLSTARTVASGHKQEGKKAQTLWFSLLYLELRNDPELKNRAAVEDAIVEIINHCISVDLGNKDGFGKDWFRLLLGESKKKLNHHLSGAFTNKDFSIDKKREIAKNRAYKIPPFEGLPRLKQR